MVSQAVGCQHTGQGGSGERYFSEVVSEAVACQHTGALVPTFGNQQFLEL